ncbi:amino acid efflux transporter [Yimella lutea]|uniref:Amino acid efflux transporter n=1 Tax=Yimella lutea TaxID=587872 RepID=A0A542EGP0_9MICO|nr:amino acid permease [Yimella lutea]TQJ14490.1 amino acid efflux transporter [Yimella lutea]
MTAAGTHELRRSLNGVTATFIALGTVLGSGIMILPGLTYSSLDRSAWIPWAIAALSVAPLLVAYSWLGRSFPSASGVAHYSQLAFGRPLGATSGVLAIIALATGIPATALTGGRYAAQFTDEPALQWLIPLVLVGTAICVAASGTTVSGRVQTGLTLSLCIVVVVVCTAAIASADSPRPDLSFPGESVAAPLAAVFVAFTGWETVAFTFEEHARPDLIPRIFAISYVIVTTVYALILLALFSVVASDDPGLTEAPLLLLAQKVLGGDVGRYLVTGFVVAAILSNVLASAVALSRLVFGMARDRHLPRHLGVLTATGNPLRSVFFVGGTLLLIASSVCVGLLPFEQLFVLSGGIYFLLYAVGAASYAALNPRRGAKLVTLLSLVAVISVGVLAASSLVVSLCLAAGVFAVIKLVARTWRQPATDETRSGAYGNGET